MSRRLITEYFRRIGAEQHGAGCLKGTVASLRRELPWEQSDAMNANQMLATKTANLLFIIEKSCIFAVSKQIIAVMTQLILNISDPSVLPTLKKVVKAFKGVTIDSTSVKRSKKCGLDEALDDIQAGRVSGPFNSMDELMAHLTK